MTLGMVIEFALGEHPVKRERKTAPLGGRHSCCWWRWAESNRRPEALDSQDYMLSQVIVLSPRRH